MFRLLRLTAVGVAVYFAAQAFWSYQEELPSEPTDSAQVDETLGSSEPKRSLFPERKPQSLVSGKRLKSFSEKRPRPLRRLLDRD